MPFQSVNPALARALAARAYSTATAVQSAVLEASAGARDLLVSAQTGSGKTVAFGIAMATPLLGTAEKFEAATEPMALIIAPTRELAMQVQRELAWLYAETEARVVSCVGGMDPREEARQLNRGAHIVVGTPGRLRDHLERRRLDLSKLRTIVLDEADEMLDLGFREDLEFILDATPAERQTLLFSATLPREIETLAVRYQRDAVRIATAKRNEQHADIDYTALRVAPKDVENAIVNVLRFHEMRAALVFCTTREAVKRTHARLQERGFSAVALSGELTQHERTHALQAVRDGRARVLVATDVAARGLDLPDLALVIHAELPHDTETFLHRSGRTGRAGKKGLCVLIVPFNRRRKAETLLGAARIRATWGTPPTSDQIRARDQERFLADPVFTDAPTENALALARTLMASKTPEEIALALVRLNETRLPQPEDLAEDAGPPPREERPRRTREFEGRREEREERPRSSERFERSARTSNDRESRPPRPPREDNREMVWFRLNIGRERNADPRWILPLICKAGGITKSEVGAIRIFDRDTRFQIVAGLADQFADAVRTSKQKEGHISRVGPNTPSDDVAVADAIAAIPTSTAPKSEPTPAAADTSAVVAETRPAHSAPSSEKPRYEKRDRKDRPDRPHRTDRPPHGDKPQREKSHFSKSHNDKPHQSDKPKKPWHERKSADQGGFERRKKFGDAPAGQGHKPRPDGAKPGGPPHYSKPPHKKKKRAFAPAQDRN